MARAVFKQAAWLGGVLLVFFAGGCPQPAPVEQVLAESRQSQHERELIAKLLTAEAKLDDERRNAAVAASQADAWRAEVDKIANRWRVDREVYDLMKRQNDELRKQLDEINATEGASKTLRDDNVRLGRMVEDRDATIKDLQAELVKVRADLAELEGPR